ncbi:MAG: hypothetical protein H7832_02205 [Magnetococcus sp. DMHC-6]
MTIERGLEEESQEQERPIFEEERDSFSAEIDMVEFSGGEYLTALAKETIPESDQLTGEERVVGVLLSHSPMIWRVRVPADHLRVNDDVLLETRHGEMVGKVRFISAVFAGDTSIGGTLYPGPIVRVIRRLSSKEQQAVGLQMEKERSAKLYCKELIRELGLTMKLSKVTFFPKSNKSVFFFTAENRVDFRDLVRRLAAQLHVRVEMRQIGVRDESRLLGGVGSCGKTYCCYEYLSKFHPVSVRMAKNQNLSLNPDAISGVCGRLMCCLAYENDTYLALRKPMPKINARYWTPQGLEVVVRGIHPLSQMIEVQVVGGDRLRLPMSDLSVTPPKKVKENPLIEEFLEEEVPVTQDPLPVPKQKLVVKSEPDADSSFVHQKRVDSSSEGRREVVPPRRRRGRQRSDSLAKEEGMSLPLDSSASVLKSKQESIKEGIFSGAECSLPAVGGGAESTPIVPAVRRRRRRGGRSGRRPGSVQSGDATAISGERISRERECDS